MNNCTTVRMNENGLTWARWYSAATMGVTAGRCPQPGDDQFIEMRRDWIEGVDPTEWPCRLSGRGVIGYVR